MEPGHVARRLGPEILLGPLNIEVESSRLGNHKVHEGHEDLIPTTNSTNSTNKLNQKIIRVIRVIRGSFLS